MNKRAELLVSAVSVVASPSMRREHSLPIDQQVRALALRFAAQVGELVRHEIAAEVARQVNAILRRALRGHLQLGPNTGDRRLGKPPVPVTCPVPGCQGKGIRAKRNFCANHAAELTDAEKQRLRSRDRGRRIAAARRRRRS